MRDAPLHLRALAWAVRRLPAGRYRAMQRFPRHVPCFEARLPSASGGFRFACDLRDGIAREVFVTGAYAPQETALVRALLHPGDTFVDVGANWGYFTLVGAHSVGEKGRVLAMEPDPRLFALLLNNLERNALAQATALALAAADAPGVLALAGHDAGGGNWGLSSLVSAPTGTEFPVQAERIDQVLRERAIDTVDLLKMDIEGAEDLALRGMADGLARGVYRRVLVELHPTVNRRGPALVDDVVAVFTAAGYRGWSVDFSHGASRRAAYARRPDARAFLLPLGSGDDEWPHQLWIAPGEDGP